ncbi:MAG: hypothetical protein MHM6MM_004789 [Cercozoa sp. M6MM]
MLYIIGLGLGDEEDITVKGLKAVQSSDKVFLEAYTAILSCGVDRLSAFYGKDVTVADREMVEQFSDQIIDPAKEGSVSFLVVGDPFCATTHTDFLLRAARDKGVEVKVIHNASIMNACAACGLQLYNFGQTITLCFWDEHTQVDSWYDKIRNNRDIGLHTLALLDIKVKEQSVINMAKGLPIYEPPRYMTVQQACDLMIMIEERRGDGVCGPDAMAVGLARVGQHDQMICAGTLAELREIDFGAPLHSLVLVGPHTHQLEEEVLDLYRVSPRQTLTEEEQRVLRNKQRDEELRRRAAERKSKKPAVGGKPRDPVAERRKQLEQLRLQQAQAAESESESDGEAVPMTGLF